MLARRLSTKEKQPEGAPKRKSIWGASPAAAKGKSPAAGMMTSMDDSVDVAEEPGSAIKVKTVENALSVIITEEISRALQSFTGIPAKELKELMAKHIEHGWTSGEKGKRILTAGEKEQAIQRLGTLRFLQPADVGRSKLPVKFPLHTAVPTTNLFGEKQVDIPQRLLGIIEAWFMTIESVDRARRFQPTKGDVWIVAGPQSGENFFARIVRYLLSDRPLEVWQDPTSTAPWIESYHVNADPDVLRRPQYRRGRVFRTAMTTEMCGVRRNKDTCKYIIVARNPIDLRASWINYLKTCYNIESEFDLPPFDEVFDYDDFANEPVTLCDTATGGKPKTYEEFLARWLQEEQQFPKQIKVVCYEALVADPEREILRLIDFLGCVDYKGLVPVIMKDLAKDGIEPASKAAAAATKTKKGEKATANQSRSRRPSLGAGGAVFSEQAQSKLKLAFTNIVSDKIRTVDSYEKLYEKYGAAEPYPFPLEKPAKKAGGKGAADAGPRKPAVKLVDESKADGAPQEHTFRRLDPNAPKAGPAAPRPISVGLQANGMPIPGATDNPRFSSGREKSTDGDSKKDRPKSMTTTKIEVVNGVKLRRLVPVDAEPPPPDEDEPPPPPPEDEPVEFAVTTKKIDLKTRLAQVQKARSIKGGNLAPPPPPDDDDDAPPPPPED